LIAVSARIDKNKPKRDVPSQVKLFIISSSNRDWSPNQMKWMFCACAWFFYASLIIHIIFNEQRKQLLLFRSVIRWDLGKSLRKWMYWHMQNKKKQKDGAQKWGGNIWPMNCTYIRQLVRGQNEPFFTFNVVKGPSICRTFMNSF